MKLFINNGCCFVKGYCRAALYDFNAGKVYSLNDSGKKIVEGVLKHEIFPNKIEYDYLQKLIGLNLLSKTPLSVVSKSSEESVCEKPKLSYVWLELTQVCNLRCVHCYGHWGRSLPVPHTALSLKDWKNIIDQIRMLNCDEIQFIGGEPTIFKGFIELLEYARMSGMRRLDVFTNGTTLDEEMIEIIKKLGASVRVSLYGHNAETHEKITKVAGSFEKMKKSLRMLSKAEVRTVISVIVMRENQDCLRQIENFIISLGHKYYGYDTIRMVSDGIPNEHLLTKTAVLEPRYLTKPNFQTSKVDFSKNKNWNSCWYGKAAITATGDVIPCIFARNIISGNVKKESLHDLVYQKLITQWAITKDKVEVCRDCEYRYACHDCRPLSFGLCNNINAKYPRCCYDPYTGEWGSVKDVTVEAKNLNL